jgi:N-acetylglucosamine-6-sulfatase
MHVQAETGVFANTSAFSVFHQAGYVTAAIGKVTNDQDEYFCTDHRRDSMDHVFTACSFNDYWATKYFVANATDARTVAIPNDPSAYQTAQLGNFTVSFIKQQGAAQRDAVARGTEVKPFFAWIGPHAPHYPASVAPWYAEELNGTIAPRVPSYNYSAPNHHGFISTNPMLDDIEASFIDQHYRDRLRSLMSVDDLAKGMLDALDAEGLADNTCEL